MSVNVRHSRQTRNMIAFRPDCGDRLATVRKGPRRVSTAVSQVRLNEEGSVSPAHRLSHRHSSADAAACAARRPTQPAALVTATEAITTGGVWTMLAHIEQF